MRSVLALLAVALLGLGVAACGDASKATGSGQSSPSATSSATTATSRTSGATSTIKENDNDDHTDPPAPADDPNNEEIRDYGQAPTAIERQSIAALLKHYYAIALQGNGAKACSMIDSGLAEAVPLDYGRLGAPYLHGGKTCAAVLALLFKHYHRQLAAEVPHLELLSVRVAGGRGQILLGFGRLPERQITTIRQGGVWKVAVLLDGEVE